MSEQAIGDIETVLNDFCIVLAGKVIRKYSNSPEQKVYQESYERLYNRGSKLIEIRAAMKQVEILNERLQAAQQNLLKTLDNPDEEKAL